MLHGRHGSLSMAAIQCCPTTLENQKAKAISAVNSQLQNCEALAVSSKDIIGFDKLSKAILEFC